MLKRLRVRSKLLLLLAPVLIAVVFFAASSAQDRFDVAAAAEKEADLANLADASDRLLLALQVEQLRSIAAEAGAGVDVGEAVDATTAAVDAFEGAAATVQVSAGPELAASLATARQHVATIGDLRARNAEGGVSAAANQVQFDAILFSLDRLGDALLGEVTDTGLFRDLRAHQRLARAQDALGRLVARTEVALVAGTDDRIVDQLRPQLVAAVLALEQFRADASDDQVALLDRTIRRLDLPRDGDDIAALLASGGSGNLSASLEAWVERGETWLNGLAGIGGSLISQAVASAETRADLANGEAAGFLVLASTIVIAAILLAILIGRSISRPLRRLTEQAQRLADADLPALVDTLRSGRAIDPGLLEPIDVQGRDETAQLARAIASIQDMTVEVAEEQSALLRKGISEMFVNLARRNQALLDRQIQFIDDLERREEDPDRLQELFRLDHLATRMRRNAESLLVLAGADPTRRRGRPVEIADVVQVAVSEVEDFARIQLLGIETARVPGNVAVDLAHLLSELMENATQFSPPETAVEIAGHLAGDGSYQLTITDHGIGMSADQIARANEILTNPPVVGLELGRSLGFTVVSRIAARLGLGVQVTSSTHGGVTAVVVIPSTVLADDDGDHRGAEHPAAVRRRPPARGGLADAPVPTPMRESRRPVDAAGTTPSLPDPVITEPVTGAAAPTPDAGPVEPVAASPVAPGGPSPLEQLAQLLDAVGESASGSSGEAPPSSSPGDGTDLFASLDAVLRPSDPGTGGPAPALPQRRPAATCDDPLPSRTLPPEGDPVTGPATPPGAPASSPVDGDGRTDDPTPTGVVAPAGSSLPPPPAVRPAAEIAEVDERLTRAGLVRRRPRRVAVPESSRYDAPAPVTASRRDPEQVREMLSRYRSGLRKGRGARRRSHENRDESPEKRDSPR